MKALTPLDAGCFGSNLRACLPGSRGGVIVLTNARTVLRSDVVPLDGVTLTAVLGLVVVLWVWAIAHSVRAHLGLTSIPQSSYDRAELSER